MGSRIPGFQEPENLPKFLFLAIWNSVPHFLEPDPVLVPRIPEAGMGSVPRNPRTHSDFGTETLTPLVLIPNLPL
jgi:hypothetical protein